MGIAPCTGEKPNGLELDIKANKITESGFYNEFSVSEVPRALTELYDLEMYRIKDKKEGNTFVLRRFNFKSKSESEQFTEELERLSNLTHPNLLKIKKYFSEKTFHKETIIHYSVNVILEDFQTNLETEITRRSKKNKPFKSHQIQKILESITDACAYL
mmetsp:Transcript_246/g.214  ORF Transcript_246/g.214 Transcript_246/m.214 type:complete len:159 (+) Transcript_246:92-568(+)